MPAGWIQLLTNGKESEYLNNVPNISFFKCYFRRHTNFFINNIELFSNYYENNEINTLVLPKSGDLLSTGVLKFNFNENYIEIFENYDNLNSTLTTDITTFFDSYNIFINNYEKNYIKDVSILKLVLSFVEKCISNYFTIIILNDK
jgi:hypothetical protein